MGAEIPALFFRDIGAVSRYQSDFRSHGQRNPVPGGLFGRGSLFQLPYPWYIADPIYGIAATYGMVYSLEKTQKPVLGGYQPIQKSVLGLDHGLSERYRAGHLDTGPNDDGALFFSAAYPPGLGNRDYGTMLIARSTGALSKSVTFISSG